MQTLDVVFRPSAVDDLTSIHEWVFNASASDIVARRFTARLVQKCRKIGLMPYGGRARDDLQPGLRTFPFERTAVIVYRVTYCVEILRIYFAGQNFETLIREGTTSELSDENYRSLLRNINYPYFLTTFEGYRNEAE